MAMTIEEMKEMKRTLGYTNQMLADLSGVPYATIQKIFSGETRSPRRNTLIKLEKILSPNHPGGRWNLSPNRPDRLPLGDNPTPMDIECAEQYNPRMYYEDFIPCTSMQVREILAEYGTGAAVEPDSVTGAAGGTDYGAGAAGGTDYGSDSGYDSLMGSGDRRFPNQGYYTVDDLDKLPDDVRVELIDGVIYVMAAPSVRHQVIVSRLCMMLTDFVDKNNGPCLVVPAPLDVQLDKSNDSKIQPDISIICDRDKIKKNKCWGAPDLVVEVLSPSTKKHDMLTKLRKYCFAGVREYWMIDADSNQVIVYRNMPDDLLPHVYTFGDKVPVGIWDDKCVIDFAPIAERVRQLPGDDSVE